MLLYCTNITPRASYIADFIGKEISGEAIALTSDKNTFIEYKGPKINYSNEKIADDEFWIKPHTLLFETGISPQVIDISQPTDIFAASFYLMSRYEEYLPHEKDSYGRYDHKNSVAYKEGFLNKPLINYWIKSFKEELKKKFPSISLKEPTFTFVPTYDIDMAWAYKNKGGVRRAGSVVRALLTGRWKELKSRFSSEKDPYDAYGWMNHLHEKYSLKPYYFFLVADKTSEYDKNISPDNKDMQALIHDHAIRYPIGVHPSWQSGDKPGLIKQELQTLSKITGTDIRASRQHYIRFTLPETFQRLIDAGIQFEFSMGYGHINGFRASVASPFYWYDLKNEKATNLLLFPWCYMDANSFYEQKYTAAQALQEMKELYENVKKVNGTFIMIWHNSFLGTDPQFAGWREMYEEFIKLPQSPVAQAAG